MNIKLELARFAVRVIADKTDLIQKPDATSEFINALFGIESQEERLAKKTVETVDKIAATAKRVNASRKSIKPTRLV